MAEWSSAENAQAEPLIYHSEHSFANKLTRALWSLVWLVFFRVTPRPFSAWRRCVLRLFGARIGNGATIAPSATIWAPWNLIMEEHASLADGVVCFNVDKVHLGPSAIVSQYSILCTASHDIRYLHAPLVKKPITLKERAWVGMDSFIGMGVTIGEFAVVGARSSVFKDVEKLSIVGGSPAKFIKQRNIIHD